MGKKMKEKLLHAGIALTGVMMISTGFVKWAIAEVAVANTNGGETVQINLTQEKVFAQAIEVNNMAPGERGSGTLVITNTGNTEGWVQIKHHLNGSIFQNNGVTGTTLDPNRREYISVDYKNSGDESMKYDNHPLQISYSIQVGGLQGSVESISVPAFSSDNLSPSFKLPAGQKALVTYDYYMPLEAHNDYQGATGQMDIEVNISADINHSGGGDSGGGDSGGGDSGVTPGNHPGGTSTSSIGEQTSGNFTSTPGSQTGGNPQPTPGSQPEGNAQPTPGSHTGGNLEPTPISSSGQYRIVGGTSPVTGLPFDLIILEGLGLLVIGGMIIVLSRGKPSNGSS